jgi:hypothetical protein
MPIMSRFITTSRLELFHIGQILAAAVDAQLLQNKDDPVIVSIQGSSGAGKSVVAEAFRERVVGRGDGSHSYHGDEIDTGRINGQPVEVGFLDSSFESAYNNDAFNQVAGQAREDLFMSLRQNGGIAIIQNKLDLGGADIEFWVENNSGRINNGFPSRLDDSGLKKEFNDTVATHGDTWVRYVEINISDKLASSPAIKAAVKTAVASV